MWTIAVYAWKGDTDPPEYLWSAERVHFDIDDGVEWWDKDTRGFINEFAEYDVDLQNKIIIIYRYDTPDDKKKSSEEIVW